MKKLLPLFLLLLLCLRAGAAPDVPVFSLAILPDTQMYSRYDIDMFTAQTRWIAEHAASDNIVFTMHLGDVVDRNWEDYEWKNADKAIQVLDDARLPYSMLAGNHDVRNSKQLDNERDTAREPFMQYFPPQRRVNQPGYGGHSSDGFSSYSIVRVSGQRFLIMALDWRLSPESRQWVQWILDAYRDLPTIITTHSFLTIDRSTGQVALNNNGKLLWNELIAANNQIFLVMSGHVPGVGHMMMQNNAGNDVLLMLVDYQNHYGGGNGMLRLITFDLPGKTINVESFSPYVMGIPPNQRTPEDKERLTDAANQFNVKMDIIGRLDRVPAGFL